MDCARLINQTLLLTGANGGIARAIAKRYLEDGGNVVLADVRTNELKEFEESVEYKNRAAVITMDASDPASIEAGVSICTERFGGIDLLVPAAGIYPECSIAEMTDAQWRQVMSINLDGVFFLCRAAIPYLRTNSAIVTIASLAAHRGSFRHGHYSASKGGILSFTRSLALELAPAVRVNAVSPGIIETPMTRNLLDKKGEQLLDQTPMKRLGQPDEVAAAVLFLASSEASFITGEVLHVNGGLYLD